MKIVLLVYIRPLIYSHQRRRFGGRGGGVGAQCPHTFLSTQKVPLFTRENAPFKPVNSALFYLGRAHFVCK